MWRFLKRARPTAADETGGSPDLEASAGEGGTKRGDDLTDDELLERIATRITSMRLGVPAILFLESSKPLSFVGSQFLVFMEPFVKTFFTARNYDRFAALMEDRESYELLIRKVEAEEERRDTKAPATPGSKREK